MPRLRIEVVRALPERHEHVLLELAEGATVAAALRAAGLSAEAGVGIFGRLVALDRLLADGDRVEVYRPLRQDPREVRRRRALKRTR
jgi:uncharacterized protein